MVRVYDSHDISAWWSDRRHRTIAELCSVNHADISVSHESILGDILAAVSGRLLLDRGEYALVLDGLLATGFGLSLLVLHLLLLLERHGVNLGHMSCEAIAHFLESLVVLTLRQNVGAVFVNHLQPRVGVLVVDHRFRDLDLVSLSALQTRLVHKVTEWKLGNNLRLVYVLFETFSHVGIAECRFSNLCVLRTARAMRALVVMRLLTSQSSCDIHDGLFNSRRLLFHFKPLRCDLLTLCIDRSVFLVLLADVRDFDGILATHAEWLTGNSLFTPLNRSLRILDVWDLFF